MRLSLLGCTALASTTVLACNDVSSPTPPADLQGPSYSATVNRFTVPYFNFVTDESSGLIALLGLSPDLLADACAGEDVAFDQVKVVEVFRPDGSLKITVQGRVRTLIYSLGSITDVCELTGSTPLATGRAHVLEVDNDVFVSGNRTNSFGANLEGTASGPGGRFKVQGKFRIIIQRNGEGRVRNERFNIRRIGR
jgi:hypothetical protein